MKRIIKLSYIILMIIYLLTYLKGNNIPVMIPMILNIVVLVGYLIKNRNIRITKRIVYYFIGLLFIFIIYPLITITNSQFINNVEMQILRNFIFTVDLLLLSVYLVHEKKEWEYMKLTYILTGIFICSCYIINFDNFEVFKKLKDLFSNTLRYRYAFGMSYVNAAAQLCMLTIILWFILKKVNNSRIKLYEIIINIIALIVLLSTSSRDGIFSLIIFFVVYYFFILKHKVWKFVKGAIGEKYFNAIFILIVAIIIGGIISYICVQIDIGNINLNKILEETNRLGNLRNIALMQYHNRFILGIGAVNPGIFLEMGTHIDSWYLYMFETEGLIGIVNILILIICLIISIFGDKRKDVKSYLIKAVLLGQLFYSLFETAFYYPAMITSYIFWIMYLVYIAEKNIIKS